MRFRRVPAALAAVLAAFAAGDSAASATKTARPRPPTEVVTGDHALAVHAQIKSIAADGARLAFVAGATRTDCRHIAVWTPATRSVRRFAGAARPCDEPADSIGPVALAGTRVAWLWTSGTGNTEETSEISATLSHPSPPWSYIAHVGASRGTGAGAFARRPAGDGALVVFTVERSCDSNPDAAPDDACPPGAWVDNIYAATLYRIGGAGPCIPGDSGLRACTPIMKASGRLRVLAVDAGRIAVRTESGIALLTSVGSARRDFAVTARAAALSGKLLAVRTANAVEVYDTNSSVLVTRLPSPRNVTLEDLDRDLLVTASGGTVTVRRLGDGHTTTVYAGGVARAQLERPGLFVAGGGRATFTPMRDLTRRLGEA